jgi:hypothetical protein
MRNIGFIIVIVIYAAIYIIRLARKSRPKAPLPHTGDIFPREDDEEEENIPALKARVPEPEPERLAAAADTIAAAKPEDEAPAKGGLFRRLEKMTPLARALVMSEVLGKPKGAEGYRHHMSLVHGNISWAAEEAMSKYLGYEVLRFK